MGRLSLIKQHQVMFLAWLPYSQGSLNKDGTFYSSATAEKSATQSAKGTESCCNVLLKCKRCAFRMECSQRGKQWPHKVSLCLQHHIRFCNLLAKLFAPCLSTHDAPGAFAVPNLAWFCSCLANCLLQRLPHPVLKFSALLLAFIARQQLFYTLESCVLCPA